MAVRSILVNVAANVGPYVGGMQTAGAATGRFAAQSAAMRAGEQGPDLSMRTLGTEGVGLDQKLLDAAGPVVAMKMVTDAAIGWESAFAGVRKTVDGTDAELAAIAGGLRGMSKEITTSANDLAAIAESAGQLGIETSSI